MSEDPSIYHQPQPARQAPTPEDNMTADMTEIDHLPGADDATDPLNRNIAGLSRLLATLLKAYADKAMPDEITAAVVAQAAQRLSMCPLCLVRETHSTVDEMAHPMDEQAPAQHVH